MDASVETPAYSNRGNVTQTPGSNREQVVPITYDGIEFVAHGPDGQPDQELTDRLSIARTDSGANETLKVSLDGEHRAHSFSLMIDFGDRELHVESSELPDHLLRESNDRVSFDMPVGERMHALTVNTVPRLGGARLDFSGELVTFELADGRAEPRDLSQLASGPLVFVSDQNATGITTTARLEIPGDHDANLAVDFSDIVSVIDNFGLQTSCEDPALALPVLDSARDGSVDFSDIISVIDNFGVSVTAIETWTGSQVLSPGDGTKAGEISVEAGSGNFEARSPCGFPYGMLDLPLGTSGFAAWRTKFRVGTGSPQQAAGISASLAIPQEAPATINGDLNGNFYVPAGSTSEVATDAFTVDGDLTVLGTLTRNGGPFTTMVTGNMQIGPQGMVSSILPLGDQDDPEEPTRDGLTLIVNGGFSADPGSILETNGNLILTDSSEFIPRNEQGHLAVEALDTSSGDLDQGEEMQAQMSGIRRVSRTVDGERRFSAAPMVTDVDPLAGLTGEQVTFQASLDDDFPDADSYDWNFGDGATPQTSTDEEPTVTLEDVGAHVGELTVESGPDSETVKFVFLVFQQNLQPAVKFWNNCAAVNLNPPPFALRQITFWMYSNARQAGCFGVGGGGAGPGGGGGGPLPPLPPPGGGGGGGGPGGGPPAPPPPPPNFPNLPPLNFPDGRDGRDRTGNCGFFAGRDGRNGPTGYVWVLGNWVWRANQAWNLGRGGDGGDTTVNCDECGRNAEARGGDGGRPSRIQIKSGFNLGIPTDIKVEGLITINTARAGHGGNATATTADCPAECPGEDAGDATAIAGDGNHAFFGSFAGGANVGGPVAIPGGGFGRGTHGIVFWSRGQIKLTGPPAPPGPHVTVAGMLNGGNGGDASATAGDGGDGSECGCDGGMGGGAEAEGGRGGISGYQAFSTGAQNGVTDSTGGTSGNGGSATANAGDGGNGGSCPKQAQAQGGDGGDGGNSEANAKSAGAVTGTGIQVQGVNGAPNATPGNGGNGGDGCPPGGGGSGGSFSNQRDGNELNSGNGAPGMPGIDNCFEEIDFLWWFTTNISPSNGFIQPGPPPQNLPIQNHQMNPAGTLPTLFQHLPQSNQNSETNNSVHQGDGPSFPDHIGMTSDSFFDVWIDLQVGDGTDPEGNPLNPTVGLDIEPARNKNDGQPAGDINPSNPLVIAPLDAQGNPFFDPQTDQPFNQIFESMPPDSDDGDPLGSANDTFRVLIPNWLPASQVSTWRIGFPSIPQASNPNTSFVTIHHITILDP